MKNLIILVLITLAFSCKAQILIKPLNGGGSCDYSPDCYEKDVNNEFNKFVGEWKFTNGNTSLIFKLKKELNYQTSSNTNYEDLLVGEYKYIENGIERVNTLSDFNNNLISGYQHKISGGYFVRHLPNYCSVDNSSPQEIKIGLSLNVPGEEFTKGDVYLRYVNDNGIEKLQACILDHTTMGDDENAQIPIADGYYVFVKQN